ncbi:MAG: hypothetical protein LM600_01790 [Thaumarchaeota archaeon]|nr:hypothetical protein [Nitrososphaerota archaeon]
MCPRCSKKYWRGSHWRNISRTLEEARKRLQALRHDLQNFKYLR